MEAIVVEIVAAAFAVGISGAYVLLRYVFDVKLVWGEEVDEIVDEQVNGIEESLSDVDQRLNYVERELDEQRDATEEFHRMVSGGDGDLNDGIIDYVEENMEQTEENMKHIQDVKHEVQRIRIMLED